ncbi:MAG: SdrD B-like domain-containing protein, partial [Microcoleaceae cyanobacterium MO_207.B10]|nr:SdrD B-like domain-containing protein [Microcoleaceae cyanobacterium MO_207.B10]
MVTLMANKETLESEQIESSQLNPTGNISGLKFNDINSNGRLDPDEFGLGNFTIYLDINNNGFLDFNEPANITNNDGSYFFGNLPPNNYVIREIQQPGFIQTTPDPFITVYPGSNITGINIGNTSNISSNRGSIRGTKFNDTNTNGRLDPGELGLGDITLYLDLNQNGFFEDGEARTITDSNGEYAFSDLPSNTYIVREISPPGFIQTTPDPVLNITPGTNVSNINIGNVNSRGSIRGTKFNDTNTNGRLDPGELGLGDVTLYLDLNNNGFFEDGEARTITDGNGQYSFQDIPADTYTIREIPQPGFIQTTPDPIVNVRPGNNITDINIGNVNSRGSISGTKFNDTNTNGRLDPGELGLGDVTLYLDLNNNGFFEDGEARTITDGNGQ